MWRRGPLGFYMVKENQMENKVTINTGLSNAEFDALKLAQVFHEVYEEMAPHFDYKTRDASAVPWADVPENNRKLMIAVSARIISRLFWPRLQREQRRVEKLGVIIDNLMERMDRARSILHKDKSSQWLMLDTTLDKVALIELETEAGIKQG